MLKLKTMKITHLHTFQPSFGQFEILETPALLCTDPTIRTNKDITINIKLANLLNKITFCKERLVSCHIMPRVLDKYILLSIQELEMGMYCSSINAQGFQNVLFFVQHFFF